MNHGRTVLRTCTLVLALLVVLGSAAPAAAASTTVQTDAALTEQTHTEELTFTFTPSTNTTVTATDRLTRENGNVTFSFDSWERTDGTTRGNDRTWQVTGGKQYRVTYQVKVTGSVSDTTYDGRVYVEDSGGSTVASERLAVSVDVLYPEFGYVDTGNPALIFDDPNAQSQSTTFDVAVPNDGRGTMVLSDASFSNVPAGLSVDASLPMSTIAAGSEEDVAVSVTADDSVSAGSYSFTMTLTDNLGNTQDVTVTIDVEKPPIASVTKSTVDVGDVLNGSSKEIEFTINEVGGNEGITGVSVETTSAEQSGTISFQGTRYVSTQPGGSDTATVTVSADSSADQHARLSWTVDITPDDENAPTRTFTVTGRVIYPAKLERVEMSPMTIPFDEPKSTAGSFEQSTSVDLVNSGDLEMEVQGISASMRTGSRFISASIAQAPATVDGLSTGEATLVINAAPDTPEGSYRVAVEVETADAGTKTIVRTIEITQEPKLGLRNEVAYGDVTITENQTKTVDVFERLEYESIEGLAITKVSGPDRWLTIVERPPGTIRAGGSSPFIVALQFGTQAELYKQYQWQFRVSGDNVKTQNITITARPKPYSFDQITAPLQEHASGGGWAAQTASPMNEMLLSLESKLKGDTEVPSDDLSTALAVGRATLLFVDSLEQAQSAQKSGNYSEAQRALARAAVARNLMREYVDQIEQRSLRETARSGIGAADRVFERTAEDQRRHYRDVLEANESLFRNAQAHRALMRLNEYVGNDQAAAKHREAYRTTSDRYLSTVDAAAEASTSAELAYAEYRENATVVLGNYPLVLNPARLDSASSSISQIKSLYSDSIAGFARAGVNEEETAVQQRANAVSERLRFSWYGLLGVTILYAIGFLVLIGRLSYNVYTYYQDATSAASGAFLVERGE